MSLWILFRFGLLLDYKKENFAVAEGTKRLYYIDDEIYGYETWRDLLNRQSRLLS
jgi:hypothetical protein